MLRNMGGHFLERFSYIYLNIMSIFNILNISFDRLIISGKTQIKKKTSKKLRDNRRFLFIFLYVILQIIERV